MGKGDVIVPQAILQSVGLRDQPGRRGGTQYARTSDQPVRWWASTRRSVEYFGVQFARSGRSHEFPLLQSALQAGGFIPFHGSEREADGVRLRSMIEYVRPIGSVGSSNASRAKTAKRDCERLFRNAGLPLPK